jgi:membrane associated rhomboid family serine protease
MSRTDNVGVSRTLNAAPVGAPNAAIPSMPFGNLLLVGSCTLLFLCQQALQIPLSAVCIDPELQISSNTYRLFTAPFFHVNLVHIFANMIVLLDIGPPLERRLGSFLFLFIVFLMICVSGVFRAILAMSVRVALTPFEMSTRAPLLPLLSYIRRQTHACAVGFSGVLFAFLVIHVHQFVATDILWILGVVPCPSRFYPLALLVLLQLMVPAVDLCGHLAGMLVGYTYVRGWLWPLLVQLIPGGFIRNLDEILGSRITVWAAKPSDEEGNMMRSNRFHPSTTATSFSSMFENGARFFESLLRRVLPSRRSSQTRMQNNLDESVESGIAAEVNTDRNQDVILYADTHETETQAPVEQLVRAGYQPNDAFEALAEVQGDVVAARLIIDTRLTAQLVEIGFDSTDIEHALHSGCPKTITAIVEWISSLEH